MLRVQFIVQQFDEIGSKQVPGFSCLKAQSSNEKLIQRTMGGILFLLSFYS